MDKTLHFFTSCGGCSKYFLVIFITYCIINNCYSQNKEVKILFVGDILLSRNVRREIETRKTFPWENLRSLFHSEDLVIGNLEGAVGKADKGIREKGSPVFDIDSLHIPLLQLAGFNVLTVENNHINDLGIEGRKKTLESLRFNRLSPVDYGNSPQFFTVNDIVISLIALNIILSADSSKNSIPSIEVSQKLRLAKSLSNLVIVSIHWGSELLEWPNKNQYDIARWLVKNGADLIIGGHPHVIQQPELIEGKPVFFSLGNHLFDQKYATTKTGLMVSIAIKNGKFTCKGITTRTAHNSFYPEISDQISYNYGTFTLNTHTLAIGDFNIRPKSVLQEGQYKIMLEGFQDGKKIWHTGPKSIVTLNSGKIDGKTDYLFALERHYSSLDNEVSLRPYVYSINNQGIYARWRGSGLAWPLLDAMLLPDDNQILCALHRGDSFINPNNNSRKPHVAAYKWNGFGFTGNNDTTKCKSCQNLFEK